MHIIRTRVRHRNACRVRKAYRASRSAHAERRKTRSLPTEDVIVARLLRGVATGSIGLDYSITNPHLVHMWWVSCTEFMTDIFLDKLDIPKDKIDFILLIDAEGVLSLKRGLVDIAPPHLPFYKPIEQTEIANVLIMSRETAGLDAWTGMWAFTESLSGTTPKRLGTSSVR